MGSSSRWWYQCRLCLWCHGLMNSWISGRKGCCSSCFFVDHLGQKFILDEGVRSAAPYVVQILFHTQDIGVRVHVLPLLTCFWCSLILFDLKERSQISQSSCYPRNLPCSAQEQEIKDVMSGCLSRFRISPLGHGTFQLHEKRFRSCSDWWLLPSELCLPELGGKLSDRHWRCSTTNK